MHQNKLLKILVIMGCIFFIISNTIILALPPANGFELSIYDQYPFYYWILLIISLIIGFSIIIFFWAQKRFRYAGLFLVIIVILEILAIPIIRNYAFYPYGDGMTHVGFVKDILKSAQIGNSDFYPLVHVLGFEIYELIGDFGPGFSYLLYLPWTLIYIISIYIITNELFKDNWLSTISTLFSMTLFFSTFHTLIHPSMYSLFLIPLFYFAFFKVNNEITRKIYFVPILLLLGIAITFGHPVTCIYLIFSIIFLMAILKIFRMVKNDSNMGQAQSWTIPLLLSILFFSWYFSFIDIKKNIGSVLLFLFQGEKTSLIDNQISIAYNSNREFIDLLSIFLFKYGAVIIIIILSTIMGIFIMYKYLYNKMPQSYLIITSLFVSGLFFSIFSLFGFTGEYSVYRVLRFSLWITPLLLAIMVKFSMNYLNRINLLKISNYKSLLPCLSLLVILITISSLNMYGSELSQEQNLQVTYENFYCVNWLNNNQNEINVLYLAGIDVTRYNDYLNGIDLNPTYKVNYSISIAKLTSQTDILDSVHHFDNNALVLSKTSLLSLNWSPYYSNQDHREILNGNLMELSTTNNISLIYSNSEINIYNID